MAQMIFGSYKIVQSISLSNGDNIHLVDEACLPSGKKAGNLFRVGSENSLVWKLEIPTEVGDSDYLTDIRHKDSSDLSGNLLGYRVTGFDVEIDVNTGRIVSEEMVK